MSPFSCINPLRTGRWKLNAAALLLVLIGSAAAQSPTTLPGTTQWEFPQDIVAEQYREMRAFYEREIAEAARSRGATGSREEFRRMIGAVDNFLPPKPEITPLNSSGAYEASFVNWPVLRLGNVGATGGFSGALVREYGILLVPKAAGLHPAMIAVPEATNSPEQYGPRFTAAGYVVFAPFFTQRRPFSEPWTDDRSWLFRLAYQVGRHLIGSEVQQVSSAVDFLATLPQVDPARIGVAGTGQGGLTALYAAACDTRLAAAIVGGYFDRRENAFDEPEDRTLWKHLVQFGDAEIAALIAPRLLIIAGGGPKVQEEFTRARRYYEQSKRPEQVQFSDKPIELLNAALKPSPPADLAVPAASLESNKIAEIANAQFSQWQARYRNLSIEAYSVREDRWKPDTSSIENYRRSIRPKVEAYLDMIGRYPDPSGPLDAKSVKLYDEPDFAGYRLSVRTYEEVHAYGILLVPKRMRPGERHPVVFTQHGLAGIPEDAHGVVANPKADAVYSRFGKRLAERGYIVFAPMISTQSGAERTRLVRRAHLLGQTPVGMEAKKFSRVLDFLSTLPFVDKDRFAFYGLSYGGYTALWTGPVEPRFQVVIASGHFNDWNLKTTDLTEGTSFLFYKESFDQFNFDMLHGFNHSDLASLVAPRAFLIEIGDQDGVVMEPRRFVDIELERVEALYRRLGIPERGRVARFNGPHKIDGTMAFPFLDRWLEWKPAR